MFWTAFSILFVFQGITPFPYKVAKALDPDIYRNIEFDSWSDYRKEMRARSWYSGGANLQIGVKCLVKLSESQDDLMKCHIQEMNSNDGPCVVFVEELAEKHSVTYSQLQPLHDAQPWLPPYRFCRNRYSSENFVSFDFRNEKKYHSKRNKFHDFDGCKHTKNIDLDQYTNLSNFQPYPYDIVAMPLTISRNSERKSSGNKPNHRNSNQSQQVTEKPPQIKDEPDVNCNPEMVDAQQHQQYQEQQHYQEQQQYQEQPADVSVPPPPTGYMPNNGAGGLVHYYYPSYGGSEFNEQHMYTTTGEVAAPQAIYSMPPGVPYGNAVTLPAGFCPGTPSSNNPVYTPIPLGNWPNYNAPLGKTEFYRYHETCNIRSVPPFSSLFLQFSSSADRKNVDLALSVS